MAGPPRSVEQVVLSGRVGMRRSDEQRAEARLPLLRVEVVFVEEHSAQHGRELVERLEQLDGGRAQRLRARPFVALPHVGEDRVLGPRRDQRLAAALDEHLRPLAGATAVRDRHQADDAVGAPVLAVAEGDHVALHRNLTIWECVGRRALDIGHWTFPTPYPPRTIFAASRYPRA